ncbi:MAG: restriction endonuclease subunit S [Burkholderiales bacterium]|nr:restriction endonuclease subunit S [Burkholderiales bacterium]
MKRLNELFDVSYGNKFDLNKMRHLPLSKGGVCFVGRSSQNHGVSGTVAVVPTTPPYETGLITVALGGAKLLSSFVQQRPFYTAQNVAVLRPLQPMSFAQKLYLCLCIRHNRFRYSAFGREANRTLRTLLVPEPSAFPSWVADQEPEQLGSLTLPALPDEALHGIPPLLTASWKEFRYDEIFEIRKGYYNKKPPMSADTADVPFIGATEKRNGITGFVAQDSLQRFSRDGSVVEGEPLARKLFPAPCVTVTNNGSVGEAFYQDKPFTCSHDVNPLYLKDKTVPLTPELGLFLATVIRADKYRWSFGRKWRPMRMPSSVLRLPVNKTGAPNWAFMERYMRLLPFSSQLE